MISWHAHERSITCAVSAVWSLRKKGRAANRDSSKQRDHDIDKLPFRTRSRGSVQINISGTSEDWMIPCRLPPQCFRGSPLCLGSHLFKLLGQLLVGLLKPSRSYVLGKILALCEGGPRVDSGSDSPSRGWEEDGRIGNGSYSGSMAESRAKSLVVVLSIDILFPAWRSSSIFVGAGCLRRGFLPAPRSARLPRELFISSPVRSSSGPEQCIDSNNWNLQS